MRSPLFLTLFLLLGGAFTLWCSVRNYNWFFRMGFTAEAYVGKIVHQLARAFYILIALVMLGWGGARLIDPPREIPVDFIDALGKPGGIDLVPVKEAEIALLRPESGANDLVTDAAGWASFWVKAGEDDPAYADAAASAVAGPDFAEGYHLRRTSVGRRPIGGRIIYFNENLESCDNVLFSKRPLNSAAFVMVVCSEEISAENGVEDGVMVYYLRAGTEAYAKVTRF